MFRTRRSAVALVAIAALLALPLGTYAAKGTGLAAEGTSLTPVVTTNQLLAFHTRLANTGSSNISNLRFEGTIDNTATFNAATTDPCLAANNGAGVRCDLGALPSGAAVELILVFNAPSGTGAVSFAGQFIAEAKNGTPGAKLDTWPVGPLSVEVRQTTDNYVATYQPSVAPQSYSVGLNSPQQTTLQVPRQQRGYPLSLAQTLAPVACGQLNYVGDTVELDVANGQSPVTLTITFAPTPGLTPQKVGILHDCEPIPTDCEASPGNCLSATSVRIDGVRRVQVTVTVPHNGSFKGFY